MKYLSIWIKFAQIRFLVNISERWASIFFITGKFVRFGLVGLFIVSLSGAVGSLKGYSLDQLIIIYLLFNFFDLTTQFLFRGIYSFRGAVLYGGFDKSLLTPLNSLFIALMTEIDFLDLPLWLVVVGLLISRIQTYSLDQLVPFSFFLINGLLIISGIHILVAAFTILFSSGEQMIHVYRDFSTMARLPIDIYAAPVRLFLNTIMPIGVAYTLPAKVLFGTASVHAMVLGIILGVVFLLFSLSLWQYALAKYSSASS